MHARHLDIKSDYLTDYFPRYPSPFRQSMLFQTVVTIGCVALRQPKTSQMCSTGNISGDLAGHGSVPTPCCTRKLTATRASCASFAEHVEPLSVLINVMLAGQLCTNINSVL